MSMEVNPVNGIGRDEFAQLVAVASRAPSVHNIQPWRFRLADPFTIEVEVAANWALPHADPTGRELVISCGAALHNLLLALRVRQLQGTVLATPDSQRPLLLASISVAPGAVATKSERNAYAAIFRRHTHRQGFDAPADDPHLIEALTREAWEEGGTVAWLETTASRRKLIDITRMAAERERGDVELSREAGSWSGYPTERRDGIPAWARAPKQRDSDDIDSLPARFVSPNRAALASSAGALCVLLTPADTIADWLTAGRALQRLLLRAAQDWAFAAFATPALEHPDLRDAVAELLGTSAIPQMILELGHSRIAATTGRLDVSEFIAPAGR